MRIVYLKIEYRSDLATCGVNPNTSLKKKNPTSSLKTYLLGLETGSRIFGIMISAKKTAKIHRKIILKLL
jgi:hypothetical protein